jgi:hypothetical protein
MNRWALTMVLLAGVGSGSCGGGSDSPSSKTCLSDQQVCQFTAGVSTTNDVRNALGPPQVSQSISNGGLAIQQWVYVCQQTSQTVDVVQFIFDGNGVLQNVGVTRSGPGTTPAPSCPAA